MYPTVNLLIKKAFSSTKVLKLSKVTPTWVTSLYPHFFFKKSNGDIAIVSVPPMSVRSVPPMSVRSVPPSVHLSVRFPSRYLLLNYWTESNQICCVSCSREWGAQRHNFVGPALWGPGEGRKGQISLSLNFNYYVNFK